MGNKLREVLIPLYSTLIRLYLEHCDHLWAAQYQKDADKLEWTQQRATKLVRGWSTQPVCEETDETWIISVETRKLCGET